MKLVAIHHEAYGAYAFPIQTDQLKVRLRAKRGDLTSVQLLHGDRYTSYEVDDFKRITLERVDYTSLYDFYEAVIHTTTRRIRYYFYIEDGSQGIWFGEGGFSASFHTTAPFQYAYIHATDLYTVPEWVRGGIVYQIFPERFANGNPMNDPVGVVPWDIQPEWHNFFGGDLEGVLNNLDHLVDLGVNVIYFTPLFLSPSNHKYNITDYYQIDPQFGTLDEVKKLVSSAHQHGIRVIFDAVFNHCGSEFFAFADVIEKGRSSKYWDWFYIKEEPVVMSPAPNYETFANEIASMPKLNTGNPEVKRYLLDVARYWIREVDIDGWRLDVSNEVDQQFWREFRQVVKDEKPDALIIGEVFHNASMWLGGDQYDSVMNYIFRDAVLDFFAKQRIGARQFHDRLAQLHMLYKDQAYLGMFNLIGSHDTERFLTACEGKEERFRLAVLFQFAYTGMPMIYYGDEIGMMGMNDPDCRRGFIWDAKRQNRTLLEWYKRLIVLRKSLSALTKGSYRPWIVDEPRGIFGMIRGIEQSDPVGVLINNSPNSHEVRIPIGWSKKATVMDHLTGTTWIVSNEQIEVNIAPYEGMMFG